MDISIKTSELAKLFGITQQRANKICADYDIDTFMKLNARFAKPSSARQFIERKDIEYPKKTVCFFNSKGGVGKTSALVTVAISAAQYGAKVLVIDLDQQANASITFVSDIEEEVDSMYEVVSQKAKIKDVIINVADSIDLIPSSMNMAFLDRYIQVSQENIKTVLSRHLKKIRDDYDLILIDLPPSLNASVSSAILSSDHVVIPTTAGRYAMKGVNVAVKEIEDISEKFETELPKMNILFNMYDARKKSCKAYLGTLFEYHQDKLFGTFLGSSTLIENVRDGEFGFLTTCRKSNERDDVFDITKEILGFNLEEEEE